jgi:hypothetical protein
MNTLRFPYLCGLAALVLVAGSVTAQFGGTSEPSNNSAKKADKPSAEKPSPPAATSQAKTETATVDFCQCTEGKPEAVARIEKALASPLNAAGLDYSDVPLKEVADALSSDYNIPIQIDRNELEEAGIAVDVAVNVNLHNVSLRSALDLMTKSLHVTYTIDHEVLLITTQEAVERDLKICVYDVRAITENGNDKVVESLKEMVASCVAPETWAANGGGQAEIRDIKPGLLVVSQTQDVHQKIHDLLATIHKMSRK